jgi:RHS repeat-associated protein
MLGRDFSGEKYRFGFQNQEKDSEIKGRNNSLNYSFRDYDPRILRFFSVDPLTSRFPANSSYAFCENIVINAVELEGKERYYVFNSAYISAQALSAIKTMNYDDSKVYMNNLVGTPFSSKENLIYAKKMLGDNFDAKPGYNTSGNQTLIEGDLAVRGGYESDITTADYFFLRLVIKNENGTWSVKNARITNYDGRINKVNEKLEIIDNQISIAKKAKELAYDKVEFNDNQRLYQPDQNDPKGGLGLKRIYDLVQAEKQKSKAEKDLKSLESQKIKLENQKISIKSKSKIEYIDD